MTDDVFTPSTITIHAGQEVTWSFEGSGAHNVTGADFKSELMLRGAFEHTYNDAGTFEYRCTLHDGMVGNVVVTAT